MKKYIITTKAKDSVCDAKYIDVVKTVNRMMEAKALEENYLGCNVWMTDIAREDGFATKDVHIDMGFSSDKFNPDEIAAFVAEALQAIYEKVELHDFSTKTLKSGETELNMNLTCVETDKSEEKVKTRNEEDLKKQEELRQEELRKKVEQEEAEKARIALEKEAAEQVRKFAEQLALCKTQADLDNAFDEVEEWQDQAKLSEAQFKYLLDIYNQAEERLKAGISDKDNSLFLKLKYERQMKNAQSSADLERIRKFIAKHFEEGRINNKTLEYLNGLLEHHRKRILSPAGDAAEDTRVLDVKPRKGESKSDFISRFMSETKAEYPDEKQRLAVAYSYWRNR